MPEFEISEEQLEALERVRSDLEDTHVGRYGYVRRNDAFQFLLDRYGTDDDELLVELIQDRLAAQPYQELQRLAGMLDGVEPAGTEPELRQDVTIAILEELFDMEGTEELLEASERGRAQNRVASDSPAEGETPSEGENAIEDAESTEDEETQTEETSSNDTSSDDDQSPDDGPSRLQEMMGLLDSHSDRWSESNSEDGKYAVELPDGSTEVVRTKDDIRAVLFREYQ